MLTKPRFLLPLVLLLTSATACRLQQKAPPGVEIIHDVEYGNVNGRALHLEIAIPKNRPPKPMPAVVWIHGGGWEGGSHKQNMAIAFAGKGWFTASVEYRLSGEAKWPAQIEDCKLAIRWLRANAAKWNINPDRIGVWGISAGGHLVTCLGTMDERAGFDVGALTNFSSRVQAVVDYCGPVELSPASGGPSVPKQGDEPKMLIKLFGATYREKPAAWRSGSPVFYVTSNAPPFLVVHGDSDNLVPRWHAERLTAKLQEARVPSDLVIVKNGNHVMFPAKSGQPAVPSWNELNQRVVNFFDERLAK
ncbi:MAG: alpha/beta hydrolase [Verrucomicrobia bacterium]|nr:alpha/beta hydrolase [Verrucomicrobiota bacterium]